MRSYHSYDIVEFFELILIEFQSLVGDDDKLFLSLWSVFQSFGVFCKEISCAGLSLESGGF
jgi:hypothetical protein